MASYYSLEEQIALWLKTLTAKFTYDKYKAALIQFREALCLRNLDLNSENDFAIASIFMDWAGSGTKKTEVTSASYNQRYYALNNFYKFAIQRQFMKRNPLEAVKIREVHFITSAKPLDIQAVREGLKKVDRREISGKRDYALLCILLTTGWHTTEAVDMCYGGVVKKGNSLTIVSRKKGGQEIREVLQKGTAEALEDYLEALEDYLVVNGSKGLSSNAPIWLSFARNETKGQAIRRGAITDICKKHLQTTKVDDTRRTYFELKHLEGINGIEKLLGITEAQRSTSLASSS
jgi:site-specific recombinase XerD